MYGEVERNQGPVAVYIVADARDGAKLRDATIAIRNVGLDRNEVCSGGSSNRTSRPDVYRRLEPVGPSCHGS